MDVSREGSETTKEDGESSGEETEEKSEVGRRKIYCEENPGRCLMTDEWSKIPQDAILLVLR